MKQLSITLFLVISFLSASAQLEKNQLLIGGNLKGNLQNGNLLADMDLQLGYFIKDRLAVGIKIPMKYQNYDLNNNNSFSLERGIIPFIQFYPLKKEGPVAWYLFAESGFLFQTRKYHNFSTGGDIIRTNTPNWVIGGGFGLNAFITNHVAFNASLAGHFVQNIGSRQFEELSGLKANFGFVFFLKKSKK